MALAFGAAQVLRQVGDQEIPLRGGSQAVIHGFQPSRGGRRQCSGRREGKPALQNIAPSSRAPEAAQSRSAIIGEMLRAALLVEAAPGPCPPGSRPKRS